MLKYEPPLLFSFCLKKSLTIKELVHILFIQTLPFKCGKLINRHVFFYFYRVILRCPGCWHLTLLPYLQAAQTPRIIIGALLLGGLLCVVAIGVIETKHLATRNTGMLLPSATTEGNVFISVCHSVHGWGVSASGSGGCTPPADTPIGRHPPRQTSPRADNPPPDGHCSGRYASYWNAFLFNRNQAHIEQQIA